MRLKIAPLAAVLSVAGSAGALAQVAGTYTGTLADGTGITLTVSTDGNGVLAVTALNYGLNGTCKPGGSTLNTGWGVGFDAPISNRKASFLDAFDYLYVTGTSVFSADSQTVTGSITSYSPTFAPYAQGSRPTKSVFCTVPKQSYSATLDPAARAVRHAPGTATMFIMRGR